MNKTSIKVIKRKDAEERAKAKSQDEREPKRAASSDKEKNERGARRKIAGAVLNWISERKENNRIEEDTANVKMFGDKPLSKEI